MGVDLDTQTVMDNLSASEATAALVGLYLVPFSGIALLWFIGVIRDRIGEREDRFFATVFLGSGLLFIAMLFAAAAVLGGLIAGDRFGTASPTDLATVGFARSVGYWFLFVYRGQGGGRVRARDVDHRPPRTLAPMDVAQRLSGRRRAAPERELLRAGRDAPPASVTAISIYVLVTGRQDHDEQEGTR